MLKINLIIKEIGRIDKNGPAVNSVLEGYAILKKELDDLWDEIRKEPDGCITNVMRQHAIRLAALTIKFINEILWDNPPPGDKKE